MTSILRTIKHRLLIHLSCRERRTSETVGEAVGETAGDKVGDTVGEAVGVEITAAADTVPGVAVGVGPATAAVVRTRDASRTSRENQRAADCRHIRGGLPMFMCELRHFAS